MADNDATDATGRKVTLIGEGGETFEIPLKAAKASILIKDTVSADEGAEDGTGDEQMTLEPINMPRVKGACLKKIVEFLIHHSEDPMKEIPHPLPADTFSEVRAARARKPGPWTWFLICTFVFQNVGNQWYEDFFSDENMPRDMLFGMWTQRR